MILTFSIAYCSKYCAIENDEVENFIEIDNELHGNGKNVNEDFFDSHLSLRYHYINGKEDTRESFQQYDDQQIFFDIKNGKTYYNLRNVNEECRFFRSSPEVFKNNSDNILPTIQIFGKDKILKKDSKTAKIKLNLCLSGKDNEVVNKDLFKAFNKEDKYTCSASTNISLLRAKSIHKNSKKPLLRKLLLECYMQLKIKKEKLDKIYYLDSDTNYNFPKFSDRIKDKYEKNRILTKNMFFHLNACNKKYFPLIFERIEEDKLPNGIGKSFKIIGEFFRFIAAGVEEREKKSLVYTLHTHLITERNNFWIEILKLFDKMSLITVLSLLNSQLQSIDNIDEDFVKCFDQLRKKFFVINRRRKYYIKGFTKMNTLLDTISK
ncbi:uncharacterized protein VNE69_09196 [Vairimorpha necatrix]|uniref:Uncharacterized protein n=1 Tax=Vairimorpha necatrix TaxID=6039 RepID=A0AAX4JFB4_9MICR